MSIDSKIERACGVDMYSNSKDGNEMTNINHPTIGILDSIPKASMVRSFVLKAPLVRLTILALLQYARKLMKKGDSILDVGAGDCPYKEIFSSDLTYMTTDMGDTKYHDFSGIDFICPADTIPVRDESYSHVLCTEVLEHVPEPLKALKEFNRVLKNGGNLFITIPFIWEIHEAPYDYFRYTPFAMKKLLAEAGFETMFVLPRGGLFLVLATILQKVKSRPVLNINLFPYSIIYIPFCWISALTVKIIPLKIVLYLDKYLDSKQEVTLGFALHAIKRNRVEN